MEKVNTCKSVLTVMSVLTFQRLTKEEREAEHKNMDGLIEAMDRQRIPWRLQNALFYIGEHYDVIIIIPGKIPAPANPHKMPSNFVSINSATIKQVTPKSTYSIPVNKLLFFIFCTSLIDKNFFNLFAKKV